MRITTHLLRTLGVLAALSLVSSAAAAASPITVNLRVEGSTKTLFEGPVTTEAETFATTSSKGAHPCDYHHNGAGGGVENEGPTSGTPTTALRDAALANGLGFDAKWFGSGKEENENPGDFFVTQVGLDKNEGSVAWGYAVNYLTSNVGGCQIALAPGSEVLWAYNYFNLVHRLKLTGPASVSAGVPFTVKVVDGSTGAAIAGASIGQDVAGVTTAPSGGPVTDSAGNATITLAAAGTPELKATAKESVRSNGLSLCVHNGEDGTCGTTKPTPPITKKTEPAQIKAATVEFAGVLAGHVYAKHGGPRVLAGVVHPGTETVKEVRISLERRIGKRCVTFSGARGRFVKSRCGQASFFSVGNSLSFSYLLPAHLSTGRYTYTIEALTTAGATRVARVTFRVR